MDIRIRPETDADVSVIDEVVTQAYADVPYSDHTEHLMVRRLRASSAFVPALSLVAECGPQMAGHILLVRVAIRDGDNETPSLALAPLSVVPAYQGRGVGRALVTGAHRRARELGYRSIVLLGPAAYYTRFGYGPMTAFGIRVPLAVRPENCMILPLVPDGLAGARGIVAYPEEWTER